MTEPRRFIDEARHDLASRLLRAGKAEGPSSDSMTRARAFVQGLGAAAPSPPRRSQGRLGWVKVGVIGVSVALLWGRGFRHRDAPSESGGSLPRVASPVPIAAPENPSFLRAPGGASWLGWVPEATPLNDLPTPAQSSRSVAAWAGPVSTPPEADSFAAELRAVDSVRAAIASGDSRGALEKLDGWETGFSRKHFAEEAALLRVQALRGSGDVDGSARAAQRFLELYPQSPLAQRVRSTLEAGR
jgi:hypothetical protein